MNKRNNKVLYKIRYLKDTIRGEEDVNCPGELVAEIMDSIDAPGKEYHRIPGASHMCFYDNEKEFEKIIFSYIR